MDFGGHFLARNIVSHIQSCDQRLDDNVGHQKVALSQAPCASISATSSRSSKARWSRTATIHVRSSGIVSRQRFTDICISRRIRESRHLVRNRALRVHNRGLSPDLRPLSERRPIRALFSAERQVMGNQKDDVSFEFNRLGAAHEQVTAGCR